MSYGFICKAQFGAVFETCRAQWRERDVQIPQPDGEKKTLGIGLNSKSKIQAPTSPISIRVLTAQKVIAQ